METANIISLFGCAGVLLSLATLLWAVYVYQTRVHSVADLLYHVFDDVQHQRCLSSTSMFIDRDVADRHCSNACFISISIAMPNPLHV